MPRIYNPVRSRADGSLKPVENKMIISAPQETKATSQRDKAKSEATDKAIKKQ